MDAKATQSELNDLIATLKEGQKGYAEAMTDVEGADLKDLFKEYAAQRSQYITELEDQMYKLDLKPDTNEGNNTVVGTVHRAFINLKAAVTGKDRHSILAECERGEDYAKSAYEKAKKIQDLPGELTTIINKQAEGITKAHDKIRDLRDASN